MQHTVSPSEVLLRRRDGDEGPIRMTMTEKGEWNEVRRI